MRPKVVVLSPACFEFVNRAVYRRLQKDHGLDVHSIIPASLRFSGGTRAPTPYPQETLPLTQLELTSSHPRLQTFRGAGALVEKLAPSHLLVDSDPASLMVVTAAKWAKRLNAKLWAVTCENLPRHYSKEALSSLARLNVRGFVGSAMTEAFSKMTRSSLDRVFTISRDGTQIMNAIGFEGRVTQIPLGFDPELFRPRTDRQIATTREKCGLTERTFAYFGRLVPEKGVDLFIRALSGLMSESWQLMLDDFEDYGGAYQKEIKALLESTGVIRRTVFFRSSHGDIGDYMSAADIVVLPSISTPKWKEQYGRVVPEAMACGKVVVGAETGAIPELIGDCGLTFPEGNVEALRATLSRLLQLPAQELSRIGKKAHDRAHAHLSAARQAEIFAEAVRAESNQSVDLSVAISSGMKARRK